MLHVTLMTAMVTLSPTTSTAWRLLTRHICSQHPDLSLPHSHRLFSEGELGLAIDSRRRRLFKLARNGHLNTSAGQLNHKDIIGRDPGTRFRTAQGVRLVVRRPSLEEYTLLMPRAATPSYCSGIYAALCALDVGTGSQVVEAGTGSGAMTLHLSRAVGVGGRVLSFEVNSSHLDQAMRNWRTWMDSWNLTNTCNPWPDNVTFYPRALEEAGQCVEGSVDAVFLDLPNPRGVLSTVQDLLHPCKVAVLFLPNITQVVAVDAHIRENALSLKTENIVEVVHRQWTVKPAHTKHWPSQLETLSRTPTEAQLASFPGGHLESYSSEPTGGKLEGFPGTPTGGHLESYPSEPTEGQLESSPGIPSGGQLESSPGESTGGQLNSSVSSRDGLGTEVRSSQTRGGLNTPHTYSAAVPAYIARPSHRQDPHTGFLMMVRRWHHRAARTM